MVSPCWKATGAESETPGAGKRLTYVYFLADGDGNKLATESAV